MTNRSEGLRGNEFQTYFNKFPHILQSFSGVCAIDELPQNIAIRHFLVFNLSEKHLVGSHWAIILRSSVNQIEVFNSLGQNNVDYLMPYLKFKKPFTINFNEKAVQSISSHYCGFFSIYFIIFRILNFDMSFENVLEDLFYSNSLIKNDSIVSQFCENILTSTNDDFFCFHDF